jgi:uncharacterized membrane-anchored protein YjiN (DUF445 family)
MPDPSLDAQRAALRRAKAIALAMLVVAAAVFITARSLEDGRPWVGYVRAFAEAAMVGGLADWFAVTALFRHPLRLPIPHTAIIAKRKDEIGRGLGEFVRTNFLVPSVLEERVRAFRPAERLATWAAEPTSADRVGELAARAVRAGGRALRDVDVQDLLVAQVRARLEKVEAAPVLGRTLTVALADGRQASLVDATVDRLSDMLALQLPALRTQFEQESPWWVPESIDNRVFARIVDGVERLLSDVRHDRTHPVRRSIENGITKALADMQTDPSMIAKGERWKAELLDRPEVAAWVGGAWHDVRAAIEADLADRESDLRRRLDDAIRRAGARLASDAMLATKVDDAVVRAVLSVAESSGAEVATLIETTVNGWDTEETVDRIETQIGRDLQFVRMNGTIVGGLIGVALHTISQLF